MEGEKMSQEFIAITLKEIRQDVSEIKLQTQKTNGRVSALENFKQFFLGAGSVIASIVVPIFLYMLYHTLK